ncbi:RNA polymerase sigma factor [Allokutzneria albata]|uniref:RNA polymerase sigma-70 factor, ECF subfamily n=1 Tax=Allokutzneria albata TaxID=211114 RepID=A0A1G9UGM0_ALLAB|nr:RNA polymerase sigma factor [Allokutzneria albata]SDM58695.1 RNA polymerase sigma-70 factor, ECF subfamily [Allokutzneria albata]
MTDKAPPASAEDDRPDLSHPDPAEAFGALFDRHARHLHRYLAGRAGPAADDLLSETFLAALQSRATYDPGRATARAWLYGIATNVLRKHARLGKRHQCAVSAAERLPERVESHEGRVAEKVDAQTRAQQLAAALERLEDRDRDVLLLSSWAQLDAAEVAEALGIPVGTVRSRLHRVRRQLRVEAPKVGSKGDE